MKNTLKRFYHSSDASISILSAMLIAVLVGFSGIAVDTASLVYWKRRLHSATEAAALAATFDLARAAEIATDSLLANQISDAEVTVVEVGSYTDDPALITSDRFQPGAPDNAVSITVSRNVPLYFMRMFLGASSTPVSSTATAVNLPLAGVAIGTGVVDADIAGLNAFITAQSGRSFNLTADERDALEATDIAVFRLFDRLAGELGTSQASIATVMDESVTLDELADAMALAISDQISSPTADEQTGLDALNRMASQGSGTPSVLIRDFLALGAHQKRTAGDLVSPGSDTLTIPAMTALMGYMQASRQSSLVDLNQNISFVLGSISVKSVVARPGILSDNSSLTTIGPSGTFASSAVARIKIAVTLNPGISLTIPLVGGLSLTEIPLVIDLGYGTATISSVACGPDIMDSTDISVSAQSGTVALYVGAITDNDLVDFATGLSPVPIAVSSGLLSVNISGQAGALMSGAQTVHFDRSDIDGRTIKSVDGGSSLDTAFTTLIGSLQVTGSIPLLNTLLKTALTPVLAAVEPILPSVLASLGLRIGYLDIQATSVRCGIPALVGS